MYAAEPKALHLAKEFWSNPVTGFRRDHRVNPASRAERCVLCFEPLFDLCGRESLEAEEAPADRALENLCPVTTAIPMSSKHGKWRDASPQELPETGLFQDKPLPHPSQAHREVFLPMAFFLAFLEVHHSTCRPSRHKQGGRTGPSERISPRRRLDGLGVSRAG